MTPQPDINEALRFLRAFRPGGPWVLCAKKPEKGAPMEAITITNLSVAKTWLDERQGIANCYFTVNPVIKPVSSKPAKKDMLGGDWLHVDCDPKTGADIESERARILAALSNYDPPPTIIISSGGGYQGFWKLDQLYRTDGDEQKAAEFERYNRQIEINLSADNCHNIDRCMRIPGTLNLPDEQKKKKGRQIALAAVVEEHLV